MGDFLGEPCICAIPVKKTEQYKEQRKADKLLHLCKTPIGVDPGMDDLQYIGSNSYIDSEQFNQKKNYKIHNDFGEDIISLSEHNLKYALSHINTLDRNIAINKIKSLSI